MKIAIVGAGISGLAAAYDLQNAEGASVTLFESTPTVGGKIQTAREGNFLIEQGPDSIFASKPWAVDLITELGLADDLMEPLCSEFSILTKGKLHPVPRALASLIPSAAGALEKAGFLTASAKRRALREAEVKAGGGHDESIASFFARRFGRSFSRLVAEPLLAGTHAGDPTQLSMAALYPSYLGMEQSHGSISSAAAARTGSGGATHRKVGFLTLRDGMATLPNRLADALSRVDFRPSTVVTGLRSSAEGVTVQTSDGDIGVDHAIVATPAYVTAKIMRAAAPDAADLLAQIRFISTAIATLAYARDAFDKPLTGNGFLVPYTETSAITGCTWSSNKWADRAPEGVLLVRAFMGRANGLDVNAHTDNELSALATAALASILSPNRTPVFSRVDRWTNAMPQYELGHLNRIARIDEALDGLPVTLVGASYRGNSISDCVRQGREAAAAILGR